MQNYKSYGTYNGYRYYGNNHRGHRGHKRQTEIIRQEGCTYDDIISRMMDIVDKELYLSDVYRRLGEKEKLILLDELE